LHYQYILNEKNEEQEKKINLFQGWVPVGGRGHKERGNESVPDGRRTMERVNTTKIHCKHSKYHNESPCATIIC
jgi:hypothetical protein